jgi:hypothetical protein
MSWLWAAISGAFSGLAQGFLALFGMSDSQKLGREETENLSQATLLKEAKTAHEIDSKNAAASDADIDKRLSAWNRSN